MWHRAGPDPARGEPADREAAHREPADRALRERVGAHAWVRLPAGPAAASDDPPGTRGAEGPAVRRRSP
jgi:hypothetical protein